MTLWLSGFFFGNFTMYWLWILLHPDRKAILPRFSAFVKNGFRE